MASTDNLPAVQDFKSLSARVLNDIAAIDSCTTFSQLSSQETMIRNEIQALQVAATRLSRDTYKAVQERRAIIENQNTAMAMNRLKEVLGDDV